LQAFLRASLAATFGGRRADVSFLIDTMLKRNTDPSDALFATIDPQKKSPRQEPHPAA